MWLLLKSLGSAMLAAVGIIVYRLYAAYLGRRIREYDSFLSLLSHIHKEIRLYLSPPSRLFFGYRDKLLDSLGFISRAASDGVGMAFSAVRRRLSISEAGVKILNELFSGFGRDSREGELRRIDEAVSVLSNIRNSEAQEMEKSLKLCAAMICAAVLGTIILLI